MRYGNTELVVEIDSLTIQNESNIRTHHFIGSNQNMATNLGRGPTRISCTLFLLSESDALALEELMNVYEERDLVINNKLYTRTVPASENVFSPILRVADNKWRMDVSFIALDPIPKNIDTSADLY